MKKNVFVPLLPEIEKILSREVHKRLIRRKLAKDRATLSSRAARRNLYTYKQTRALISLATDASIK